MARKREFDYEQAIERAMRVFWRKGYANTSMRDLLDAMEIGESSLYNVFRGKRELYLACLKRYHELVTYRRLAILDAEKSVRKAVRKAFRAVIEEIHDPKNPPGCLMANSLFADVLVDAKLRQTVAKEMKAFIGYFEKRFAAAKRSGELPKEFPAKAVAQIVVTFLQGIFRMAYTVNSKKELQKQVEAMLTGLGL